MKICGITRPDDAVAAQEAGADAIGLVFAYGSPRQVTPQQAQEISTAVGPLMVRVGVFRNAPLEQVLEFTSSLRLGAVQLHGDEDEEYLAQVRRLAPVIRARSVSAESSRTLLEQAGADAVLLDGVRPGSGKTFDWRAAAHLRGSQRLILAGGLDSRNVAAGIRALKPYGVDVSSGVESSPGKKDRRLIEAFIAAARSAVQLAG